MAEWPAHSSLRQLFGIQLNVNDPVDFRGAVNDAANDINFNLSAPDVVYNGNRIKDVEVNLGSRSNLSDVSDNTKSAVGRGLLLNVRGQRVNDNGSPLALTLNADVFDDNVRLNANWDLKAGTHNYGNIHANAHLFHHFEWTWCQRRHTAVGGGLRHNPSVGSTVALRLSAQSTEHRSFRGFKRQSVCDGQWSDKRPRERLSTRRLPKYRLEVCPRHRGIQFSYVHRQRDG